VKGLSFFVRILAAVVVGMVLFFSCRNGDKAPKGVLSKTEMVKVLSEIYIMEEKISRLSLPRDSAEKVFVHMQDKVAAKTGIPDSVIQASFDYYLDHPKEMEKIYTALVDTLQLREQRTPYRPDAQ
jgi:hypothetical protein